MIEKNTRIVQTHWRYPKKEPQAKVRVVQFFSVDANNNRRQPLTITEMKNLSVSLKLSNTNEIQIDFPRLCKILYDIHKCFEHKLLPTF